MTSLVMTRSAKSICFLCIVTFLVSASFRSIALAQQDCANGIVRLPGDVNGQITICPAIVSYAPDVARQVSALEKAVSTQKTEVDELAKLIRNLNKIGIGLATKQQSELLRNVLTRLGDAQTLTPERLQSRTSTLSTNFEDIAVQLNSVLSNPQTADKALAGLKGPLGDAISRLDFKTATDQLDTISAQLKVIDDKVDTIDQKTQKTLDAVEEMKREQEQGREQQALQQAEVQKQYQEQLKRNEQLKKDAAQTALDDPKQFIRVSLTALNAQGSWKLHALLFHRGEPLAASTLEAIYKSGTAFNRVSFPVTPLLDEHQSPEIEVNALSDRITLCFSAFDPRLSARRIWIGEFQAEQNQSLARIEVRYNLVSNPTLSLDSGVACLPSLSSRDNGFLNESKSGSGVYPHYTITMVFNAYQPQDNGPWHLVVAGGGSFVENPNLEVLLIGDGRRSTIVRMGVPKVINSLFKGQEVAIPEPGQRAVVCFSATSKGSDKRMVMRQTYDLQRRLGKNIIDFQASSQPTFTEDTGAACH